jgi:hypothetical protein
MACRMLEITNERDPAVSRAGVNRKYGKVCPLQIAIERNDIQLVQTLIRNGADPDNLDAPVGLNIGTANVIMYEIYYARKGRES